MRFKANRGAWSSSPPPLTGVFSQLEPSLLYFGWLATYLEETKQIVFNTQRIEQLLARARKINKINRSKILGHFDPYVDWKRMHIGNAKDGYAHGCLSRRPLKRFKRAGAGSFE